MAINNPYVPGDPYSYDLKWMVNVTNDLQGRVNSLDAAIQEATDQADRAEGEADRATQQADNATTDALKSEGHAVGEQEGAPVGPDSPYYQNNSKYYSEQAGSSAQDAAASEQAAADYAAHIADPVSGLVTTWLADHITQPTTPAIDTSLLVAGAAADALAAGDGIRSLDAVVQYSDNDLSQLQTGHFIRDNGSIGTNPNFAYTDPIEVKAGTTIFFSASGSPGNVAALSKTDAGGTSYTPVYLFQTAGIETCVYVTYEDCYISACFDTRNPSSFKMAQFVVPYYVDTEQRKMKIVAGAIRNAGSGWAFISDSEHQPVNLSSVSVNASGNLVIDYGFSGSKVVTLAIAPDETFAEKYRIGASVGLDKAIAQIWRLNQTIGGMVRYRSGAWNIAYTNFSSVSWDSGTSTLRVYHDTVVDYPQSKRFNISLVKAASYNVVIDEIGNDYIAVKFYDTAGNLVTTPSSNCDFILTRQMPTIKVDANDVTDGNGNFWIIGLIEE